MRMRLASLVVFVAAFLLPAPAVAQPADPVPTYTRDVAPILFAQCTTCHRPGEVAPMSLLTYKDARPWARAIATQVKSGAMPPWHADPAIGHFSNARRLTEAQKTTIARWVEAGAPEGDPKDLPPAPRYVAGAVQVARGLNDAAAWTAMVALIERLVVTTDTPASAFAAP